MARVQDPVSYVAQLKKKKKKRKLFVNKKERDIKGIEGFPNYQC